MTYYARWTTSVHTVTFDNTGGTPTSTGKTVTYNTAVGTLPTSPTLTGYTFTGWYTTAYT